MIPKVIHYCWFGHLDLPDYAKRSIDSWKKYCPDYQIREWNQSNFNISINKYVNEAYKKKKYAFVSDYARLFALYNHGGIYLDTDMELFKSLDPFLQHKAFMGFEDDKNLLTALIASTKEAEWVKDLLDDYQKRSFILDNGEMDLTTNVEVITKTLHQSHGLIPNNRHQTLKNGLVVYPTKWFCPKDHHTSITKTTNNTYGIHHFVASWQTPRENKARARRARFIHYAGRRAGVFLSNIDYFLNVTIAEKGPQCILNKVCAKLRRMLQKQQ